MRNITRCLILAAALSVSARAAAEETLHYHPERAIFRCSNLNRGLAFDGEHLWVGEFGGWVRCYDRDGKHLPARDLGGGTVKYLGHGVAACDTFVATGAWDMVTVFPKSAGSPRRLGSP